VSLSFSEEARARFEKMLARYPNREAAILPTLHLAQREFGSLSEEAVLYVASLLGFTPARIEVKAGMPVTLRFLRKDPSPCAEKVLFDDLGVAVDLSIGKPTDVTITPDKPGEYEFTCQMRMYRGVLVVR